ncbi:MAG: tannase/feruloyl esterase family alpha/beta hydrolase [Rhizobacter sp.]
MLTLFKLRLGLVAATSAAALAACGGNSSTPPADTAARLSCSDITTAALGQSQLKITLTETIAADTVTPGGAAQALPAHCRVRGTLNDRVSAVDGKPYAIGFELRMPVLWNGRFFFQGGGGTDGAIVDALGSLSGAGSTTNGLTQGFAVVSTDGGHTSEAAPIVGGSLFGIDPQARVDYGYNAVGQVTTTAKSILSRFYGQGPDRSYFVGCSNGGRQAMVAASRFADQFDGIVAGDPGFNLPKAAVQHAWDNQAFAAAAPLYTDGKPIISAALPIPDMALLASKIVEKCDALDGLADGMINNPAACKAAFNIADLTCTGAKDATCLSSAQVTALQKVFAGPKNTAGTSLYADWPLDAGVGTIGWRFWKLGFSATSVPDSLIATLGGGALPYVFITPPASPSGAGTTVIDYLLGFSFDTDAPKISATGGVYTESAMSFMTPPTPTDLSKLKARGSKMIVFHGNSDPVFSVNDTINWYEGLRAANGGDASGFARLFTVPGMNHCAGGPATDKFDTLTAIVNWVENGVAPDSLTASARADNTDAAAWPTRTRPLCAYPKAATYKGSGDVNVAANFSCQ